MAFQATSLDPITIYLSELYSIYYDGEVKILDKPITTLSSKVTLNAYNGVRRALDLLKDLDKKSFIQVL